MLKIRTAKMIRFEARWIATFSLVVKSCLLIVCVLLMFQRDSYQIFDRSPISAVRIKVKQSTDCSNSSSPIHDAIEYNCSESLFDVNDFIKPSTENSAVSIITRMIETEHVLKSCNDTTVLSYQTANIFKYHCYQEPNCILPPLHRHQDENESLLPKQELCWFQVPPKRETLNYRALDYVLFIKHFVEFPHLGLIRHNLPSDMVTVDYLTTCEYDPEKDPLCPKFRLLKILQLIETNPNEFKSMFYYGSLIEIKITWTCNLDRSLKFCDPVYKFQRLDIQPYDANPYEPGSNFLISRHFFLPNSDELHRIHATIYKLHIVVTVTGEVGKFDLFQVTTSIGSFLGILGTGSIVCDFIVTFFTNFKRVTSDK